MLTKVLAGAVSALFLAGTAHAQVTASIYTNQQTAAENATLAQQGTLGAATATTTVGLMNFNPSDSTAVSTIGDFLNNPAGLNPSVASANLGNTYFVFTGQLYLLAGANAFDLRYDDGVELSIDGLTAWSDPDPTAAVDNAFVYNTLTAGVHNFALSYGECCTLPATLQFSVNGNYVGDVPEPATWAMMLLGFAGIGLTMRSRRRPVIAQVA